MTDGSTPSADEKRKYQKLQNSDKMDFMGATLAARPFNFLFMDEVTKHFRGNLNVAQFVYYSLPDLKIVFMFVVHLAV